LVPFCLTEEVHRFFETPHDNPAKYLITLTTYVDESQHEATSRHVVVAGFCGDESQWTGLVNPWRAGLGNRKALHMKDLYWHGKAAERRTKQLLARLGPIPTQCTLSPVYGATRVSDYWDLIQGNTELEQKMCGYMVCLAVIFAAFVTVLPPLTEVKVVCEKQNQYEPLARVLFDSFGQDARGDQQKPQFKSIEFIEKDSSLLTQPSDFLAFAMGKYLDERDSRKDFWCRPIFGGKDPGSIQGSVQTKSKARKTVADVLAQRRK